MTAHFAGREAFLNLDFLAFRKPAEGREKQEREKTAVGGGPSAASRRNQAELGKPAFMAARLVWSAASHRFFPEPGRKGWKGAPAAPPAR